MNEPKIITIVFVFLFLASFSFVIPGIAWGDNISTSVTVGNVAPEISSGPAESPATDSTNPANVGTEITFSATGNDPNGENYYLIICTNSSAPTPGSGGAAPECNGGSTSRLCVSTSTADETQATCDYTTLTGDTESTDWWAFVCDANSSSACSSTGEQGSGASGSPMVVNHAPVFDTSTNNSPQDPITGTITWSTSATTDDADSGDTVKLVVCKTTGISGGTCDGGASDRWCESSAVANNPTCDYAVTDPTDDDSSYDAFTYVVDNHGFSSGGQNATNVSWTVNNIAPVVSGVSTNGGSAITVSELTTTSIDITATVSDNNGCGDISSAGAVLYRSLASGGASCSGNANNCYASITCTIDGGSCTGGTDANATYTCSVDVQFHADPTYAAVGSTPWDEENWISRVTGTDDDAQTHFLAATGVELNSLESLDITSTLGYGSKSAGSTPTNLTSTTTVTATGNVALDTRLSGVDMTDGDTHTIPVGNQRYSVTTNDAWANGVALTTSLTELETNVAKSTTTGTPSTDDIYWAIAIPQDQFPASYNGTNTAEAKMSEVGQGW